MTPKFTKKSLAVSKSMFIAENLKNTQTLAKFYQDNRNELSSEIDKKEREILSNYPVNLSENKYKFSSLGKIFK